MRRSFLVLAVAFVATLALVTVSCGSNSSSSSSSAVVHDANATDYSVPGPYPVGVRVVEIDGARTWIWYPSSVAGTSSYDTADALPVAIRAFAPAAFHRMIGVPAEGDAPVAKRGRFPVVVHSHGFGGFPEYESLHLAQVASWGFIVIAPDHTGRDLSAVLEQTMDPSDRDLAELRAALDRVRDENDNGFLRGRADLGRVAAEGHSAGGAAAIRLAMGSKVQTFIGLAPAAPVPYSAATMADPSAIDGELAKETPPSVPGLLIGGADDHVVTPTEVGAIYAWMVAPKTKVMIAGMGHNTFTDLCGPIREMGGLEAVGGALVPAALAQLAEDGCRSTNIDPARGRAVEDQVSIAWLRNHLATGSAESYSAAWVDHLFPGSIASYDSAS